VSPYDPAPDAAPVALLGVKTAAGEQIFAVSDHVVRALGRALIAYRDPADRGTCAECGSRRVDDNMHCQDCGRMHGILGDVIAQHLRRATAGGTDT
jgi:hypothetical protein